MQEYIYAIYDKYGNLYSVWDSKQAALESARDVHNKGRFVRTLILNITK